MSVPKLPPFYNMNYTDRDGNLTDESLSFNDQTWQSLNAMLSMFNQFVLSSFDANANFTFQGLTFPTFTNAEIATFGADTDVPNGTVWFSSTDSKLKVKTAASTIETITSS